MVSIVGGNYENVKQGLYIYICVCLAACSTENEEDKAAVIVPESNVVSQDYHTVHIVQGGNTEVATFDYYLITNETDTLLFNHAEVHDLHPPHYFFNADSSLLIYEKYEKHVSFSIVMMDLSTKQVTFQAQGIMNIPTSLKSNYQSITTDDIFFFSFNQDNNSTLDLVVINTSNESARVLTSVNCSNDPLTRYPRITERNLEERMLTVEYEDENYAGQSVEVSY